MKSSVGGGSFGGDNAEEFVELDALRTLCLDVRADGGLEGAVMEHRCTQLFHSSVQA